MLARTPRRNGPRRSGVLRLDDLAPGHDFSQNERGQMRFTFSPKVRREVLHRLLLLNAGIAKQGVAVAHIETDRIKNSRYNNGDSDGIKLLQLKGENMVSRIDELAAAIATLDPADQEALWEKVAALNFQRGLEALAQKYRARLAAEGKLDQTADAVMAELKRIREDIAANDYQA